MHYTLGVVFDLEDLTAPVQLAVTGAAGGPPLTLNSGAYALQNGDTLGLYVSTATQADAPANMKVTSLILAASSMDKKPSKKQTVRLSPFNKFDACALRTEWGLPVVTNIRDIQLATTISALHPLVVTAKKGAWSLTGNLSVLIKAEGKKSKPHMLAFDLGVAVGT